MAATLKDYLKNRDDVVKAKKALEKAKADVARAEQALSGVPSGKQYETLAKTNKKRLDEADKAAAAAKAKADKAIAEATDYFNKYRDKITAASKALSDKTTQANIDNAKALLQRYKAQGLDTTIIEKNIKDAEDKLAGVGKYKPTGPTGPTGGAGPTGGTGGTTPVQITATDLINTLADPKNKKLLIEAQKDLAKNFGYKGPTNGTWSFAFQEAIGEAEAKFNLLPEILRPVNLRKFISNPGVQGTAGGGAGGAGGAGGGGGPTTVKSVTKLTDAEIEEMVNKSALNLLGREINAEDKTANWYKSLAKTVKTMAQEGTVTKYTGSGTGMQSNVTTPGYTPEKATQTIEAGLKKAAPVDLARKERVDFTSWMFQQLGGSNG
jgi:hypothetical protein